MGMDGCVKANDLSAGIGLFAEMTQSGMQPSSITHSILVRLYQRNGYKGDAIEAVAQLYMHHGMERPTQNADSRRGPRRGGDKKGRSDGVDQTWPRSGFAAPPGQRGVYPMGGMGMVGPVGASHPPPYSAFGDASCREVHSYSQHPSALSHLHSPPFRDRYLDHSVGQHLPLRAEMPYWSSDDMVGMLGRDPFSTSHGVGPGIGMGLPMPPAGKGSARGIGGVAGLAQPPYIPGGLPSHLPADGAMRYPVGQRIGEDDGLFNPSVVGTLPWANADIPCPPGQR